MLGVSRAALMSRLVFGRQPYGDIVAALNPLAYWHLGELAGSVIIDEKFVQNGTYQGFVEYGVEPIVNFSIGSAVGFTGSNSYGQIPHNAAFELTEGAIAFAVQADSVAGQQMLVAKDAGGVPGGFTVDILDGQLRAYVRGTDGIAAWLPTPAGAAAVVANHAYHVVLTWGPRGSELWLDGQLKASRSEITNGITANTQPLFLAAYLQSGGPTTFADVVLDEVALFSRQLRGDQLSSMARAHSISRTVGGEFITTPEAHGWSEANTATQNATAFNAAIAAASANAGASSTGRGVVELVQDRTYIVNCSTGRTSNISACITVSSSNVEIRTRGKPSRASGHQAKIKFQDWASQNNTGIQSIIKIQANNVVVGWVELDGNKLSCGNSRDSRAAWLTSNVSVYPSFNGGFFNIVVYRGSNILLKEINSHDSLVDGIYLRNTGGQIVAFLAEDCNFDDNRRQGMTVYSCGNSGGTYDQVIFRRTTFSRTGDTAACWGEKPGWGVDIEPLSTGAPTYGLTFDDCDFDDNQGSTYEYGKLTGSQDDGRGLGFASHSQHNYFRCENCRFSGNRNQAFRIVMRDSASLVHAILRDLVGTRNGTNQIHFDIASTSPGTRFTDVLCDNCDFDAIVIDSAVPANGHSITIYKDGQNHPPIVTTNDRTTVTVNDGVSGSW